MGFKVYRPPEVGPGVAQYSFISNWGLAPCLRGACASLRAHSLAHNGFRAGSSHYKTNAMSVFEPLRRACAELARARFLKIVSYLVFVNLKL